MNLKKFAIFGIIILLISIFSGCIEEKEPGIEGELSLQELINKANSGETIYLEEKTYFESILIDKEITLDGKETIIDGNGSENVIEITSDNVKLSNLIVRNSGGVKNNAGIKFSSDNNLIENCEIYRTKTGIFLDNSKGNTIKNCYIHTSGEGIYSDSSAKNTIENCEFQHNAFGIHLLDSNDVSIKNNYVHTNGLGIYARDSTNLEIKDCAISDNTHDGGGCWIFGCKNNVISNCNIDHNGGGIIAKNSELNVVNSNMHYNMYNTVLIQDSENIDVSNCDFKNNFRTTFSIQNSNCIVKNCNIQNSLLYGVECDKESTCDFRKNWWGAKSGPSLTAYGKGDQILSKLGSMMIFPWSRKQIGSIGSDWETDDVFTKTEYKAERFKQIQLEGKDSDDDGLPDSWEEKYGYDKNKWEDHANLDPDCDALNNFEECYTDSYGSDPFYKDIFIEVDWLQSQDPDSSNKVTQEYIDEAVSIFKENDINLHIDVGNLGGGQEIPTKSSPTIADMNNMYWDYFLENDLDNPRKGIFHYTLVMNDNEETYGGFVFVGWDHLDSTAMCIQRLCENFKREDKARIIIFGIVHELGHQMGLIVDDFEGIDNDGTTKIVTKQALEYRNYKSSMNYKYFLKILTYSDGTNGLGDFDDWSNLDYSFFKNSYFDWSKA